ncbi:MAG: hypothetical protein AAGJ94_04205 [Pseudomonadota bacterium]
MRAVLSTAGPIVFLPPTLAVADRDVTLFGIPALAVYIFSAWLIGIILIAFASRGEPAD